MRYPERLLASFQELSELVLGRESVGSTLDVVSDLAVHAITGCDVASVSLLAGGTISTVGSSDVVAETMDAHQYEVKEGPCLDAIDKDAACFQIDEMSTDRIWPAFSERAEREGFQSLLSFPLKVDAERLGALNLYARRARAFSEQDRDYGAIFAAHASVALVNAQVRAAHTIPEKVHDAQATRDTVAKAVGILMEREFRSAQDAMEILEQRSEELKMKLRDSAQEVIDSSDMLRAEIELPEGFARRMLGRVSQGPPASRRRVPPALALIASFVLGGVTASLLLAPRLDDARKEAATRAEAVRVALAREGSPLTGATSAQAKIVTSGSEVLFAGEGFEQPPTGRTYQLWLLADGAVVGTKVFTVSDGIALVRITPNDAFDQVTVTIEPAGGSISPTAEPILQSPERA